MLDAGRFEVLVSDLFSGRVAVKRMGLESRVRPLSPAIERIYIYHYLHQRHRELAAQVAAVIREMDASGELGRLREKLTQQVLGAS
jgi:ABC-type amino acid transport substrate-binding protein